VEIRGRNEPMTVRTIASAAALSALFDAPAGKPAELTPAPAS
jgi:hypothetical protein